MSNTYNVGAWGIPADAIKQVKDWNFKNLIWSRHAQLEILNDQYGILPPHEYVRNFVGCNWEVVEVETNEYGRVIKAVVRREVDSRRSLVLVIVPDGIDEGLVKTCWTNLNTDNHNTLNKYVYAKP
jgi:hypothetical protein